MAMTADQSVDFELSRFAELGNELLQKLDAIREQDPIYWSETNQAWLITGHKEIVESFSGRLPLSNTRIPHSATGLIPEAEREKRFPYLYRTARYWLPNIDPPAHTRQRKLMMKAFSRSVVEGIRPHSRRFIQEALDAAGTGNRVEYVAEVCRKIPARTILRQFGIDDASVPRLHRWSIAINTLGNINTPPELLDECERTLLEMRELFMIEIEKRRVQPDRGPRHDREYPRVEHFSPGATRRSPTILARTPGKDGGRHHGAHALRIDVDDVGESSDRELCLARACDRKRAGFIHLSRRRQS
jgi:cytochrome P450